MMLPDFDKLPKVYKDYLTWHGKTFTPIKLDDHLKNNVQFENKKVHEKGLHAAYKEIFHNPFDELYPMASIERIITAYKTEVKNGNS